MKTTKSTKPTKKQHDYEKERKKEKEREREREKERVRERERVADIIYSRGVVISGGSSESNQRRVEPAESKMASRCLSELYGADADPPDPYDVAAPGGCHRERARFKTVGLVLLGPKPFQSSSIIS